MARRTPAPDDPQPETHETGGEKTGSNETGGEKTGSNETGADEAAAGAAASTPDDGMAAGSGSGSGRTGPAPGSDSSSTGSGSSGGAGGGTRSGDIFAVLRALGLVRRPGWGAGVCAAVAARIGVDPVLVRGLAVVLTLLGAPGLLLYAIGWLLLPDEEGRIELEELHSGRLAPAQLGIAGTALLGLLPLWIGPWWLFAPLWGWTPGSGGSALWLLPIGLLLAAAGIALLVWLIRVVLRARRTVAADRAQAAPDAARAAAVGPVPETTAGAPITEPEPPTPGSDDAAFTEWRRQQAAWQEQHTAWQERAALAQVSAEHRMQRRAARSARRASRRAARPRLRFSGLLLILGVALLAGVIVVWIARAEGAERAFALGAASTTVALAIGMILAGLFRRRSGLLALLTVTALTATAGLTLLPPDRYPLLPLQYYDGRFTLPAEDTALSMVGGYQALDLTQLAQAVESGTWSGTPVEYDLWLLGSFFYTEPPSQLGVEYEFTVFSGLMEGNHAVTVDSYGWLPLPPDIERAEGPLPFMDELIPDGTPQPDGSTLIRLRTGDPEGPVHARIRATLHGSHARVGDLNGLIRTPEGGLR